MSSEQGHARVRRQGKRLNAAQKEARALAKDFAVLVAIVGAIALLAYFGWRG